MLAYTTNSPSARKRYSFRPDYIADTIREIDFNYLHAQGVVAAFIDLDGTVVARGKYDIPEDVSAHLAAQPIDIYIATNRPKTRSLKNLKESLHAKGVVHPKGIVGKPFPQYYAQALKDHNLQPTQVVMIGDRFIQDIFGANAAGLRTVVVRKLDTPTNYFDHLISAIEKRFIDRLAPTYSAVKQ